ncbi:MAG: hypothetical protein ABIQ39_06310, partial [Ilumatobacteraceae bacterium]
MPVVLLSAGTRTASATPPGTPTSAYHAVTTRRLLDTRLGGFRKPSAGSTMSLEVPEALGAEAVVASITVTEPDGSGFISAYPKGSPQPLVSSIDFDAGAIISNQVTVPVDASGSFTIFTSNAAHLVVDLIGVYSPAAAAAAGRFVPLQPHRVLDTRQSEPLVGGISILVSPQVPDDAEAVVATLTVTETSGAGFLGAFPSNVPWPQTSTLNFEAAN